MSTNNITGDRLVSKPVTDAYAQGWDRIFGKKLSEVSFSTPLDWTPEEEEAFKAMETKE